MTHTGKTALKATLDLALTIGFLFLMEPRATGLSLHEWGGLGIGFLFVVHKALNWDWIKAVSRNLFRRGTSSMLRARYLVDLLLLAGFSLVIVSGMGISKTIDFSWLFGSGAGGPWKGLHLLSALLVLAGVGVHLGLHAGWIKARLGRRSGPASAERATGRDAEVANA